MKNLFDAKTATEIKERIGRLGPGCARQWGKMSAPSIATDAFTKNLIELSSGVTMNTGPCALPSEGRAIDATRQRAFNPSITPLNAIVDTRTSSREFYSAPISILTPRGDNPPKKRAGNSRSFSEPGC